MGDDVTDMRTGPLRVVTDMRIAPLPVSDPEVGAADRG